MAAPKTGLKSIAQGSSDMYRVDPRVLKVKAGWNSRNFDDPANQEHVDALAQSIAVNGVMQPLTVVWEDSQAFITDGECRWRAAMRAIEHYKADVKTVPVRSEDRLANEADRLAYQFIRNTGKPFTPLEASNHFKRLLKLGWTQQEIAAKVGMSQGRVSQILEFQTLSEPVKAMVVSGAVSPTLAVQVAREHGAAATQVLKDAHATAKSEGKSKVTAKHVEGRQSLRAVITDAFEFADVDDSAEDVVVIKMPIDKWDAIKELLKL